MDDNNVKKLQDIVRAALERDADARATKGLIEEAVAEWKPGMPRLVYWTGRAEKCDICKEPFGDWMVDGRTRMGPWALMCHVPKSGTSCFANHGLGLGTGYGQMYVRLADRRWLKVAG